MPAPRSIHPDLRRTGHVHLRVADLECARSIHSGILGFELTQRYGHDAAFVSADRPLDVHALLAEPNPPTS